MNAIQSVVQLSNIFADAGENADRACSEIFIREKLLLTSVVLAALPLSLAFNGAPNPIEAAVFAASLLPLAATLLLARGGRLTAAQILAGIGEIVVALLVAAMVGAGAGLAWLLVAAIESALTLDRVLLRRMMALIVLSAAAVVAIDGLAAGPAHEDGVALAAFGALVAGGLASWRLLAVGFATRAPTERRALREIALTEVLGDAVALFDRGGLLIETRAGFEAMFGKRPGDLGGRAFFEAVNVADRPAFLKLLGDAVQDGTTKLGTLRICAAAEFGALGHSDPRTMIVEMRVRAVQRATSGQAATEIVAVMRDTTDVLRRESEIDEARRSIDAALRSKDHFLANMSHELRTPLNAIIGFSEMLGSRTMSPADPAKQREYAGIIHQSGQHLLSVVNSILDMSKIQSGTFGLIPEPFPLQPLVEQCCDVVRLQAQNGRVEIIRDVPDELEEIVADRRACRQIVTNLLSNAVKFTPEHGRVELRVRPEGTALRISVSDTGIGISQLDLARIGDPFFQAGSSLSRPYEGTGLGLSVVRGLVGLHGGTITIESELGKGTVATIRLPLDCRGGAATSTAAIETIPRRCATDAIRPFDTRRNPDARMKQSA